MCLLLFHYSFFALIFLILFFTLYFVCVGIPREILPSFFCMFVFLIFSIFYFSTCPDDTESDEVFAHGLGDVSRVVGGEGFACEVAEPTVRTHTWPSVSVCVCECVDVRKMLVEVTWEQFWPTLRSKKLYLHPRQCTSWVQPGRHTNTHTQAYTHPLVEGIHGGPFITTSAPPSKTTAPVRESTKERLRVIRLRGRPALAPNVVHVETARMKRTANVCDVLIHPRVPGL